jgi:hypothetical protein
MMSPWLAFTTSYLTATTPRRSPVSGPPPSTVVKNRVHLDLRCDCLEDEVERLSELGARVVSEFNDHLMLCDPEGNEFCLSRQVAA